MKKLLFIPVLLMILNSCKKETKSIVQEFSISGYAQKGPFISGSKIKLTELDNNLNSLNNNLEGEVESNTGLYNIKSVKFNSKLVKIEVEGKYFDENSGYYTFFPFTLTSYVDLNKNLKSYNVNIATHIIGNRVKYLVSLGKSFDEAKTQAESELLAIFNIQQNGLKSSETWDLSSNDEEAAILLLLSSVIQMKFSSGMQLEEFISNFQTDFYMDGLINSTVLQKIICASVYLVNPKVIKENLSLNYQKMGENKEIRDFTVQQKNFLANTSYENIFSQIFPKSFVNNINLINESDTIYIDKSKTYRIRIESPANNGFSNIQVAVNSTDTSFTIKNSSGFIDGNTKRFLINMSTQGYLDLPFEFRNKGTLNFEVHIVHSNSDMEHLPTKTVIWRD